MRTKVTRKLSYRKDDVRCAQCECPGNFRESLTMPTSTFPESFKGHFFRLMIRICVQNLKFVAITVPEIMGVTKNFGQSLDTPMLPFLENL